MSELEQAASDAIVALNDWLHQHAAEFCNDASVDESLARIYKAGGTVAYITDVRERLEKALKK